MRAFALLLIICIQSYAAEGQQLLMSGAYHEALQWYKAELQQKEDVATLQMVATIYGDYLGEIDSARHYLTQLKEKPLTAAAARRITKELRFYDALGEQKALYGIYTRIAMAQESSRWKIHQLHSFNNEYPTFVKRQELLRLLATLCREEQRYGQALRATEQLEDLPEGQLESARLFARRELRTYIGMWLYVFLLFGCVLLKKKSRAGKPLLFWLGATALMTLYFYIRVFPEANSPFPWWTPFYLGAVNVPPLLWALGIFGTYRQWWRWPAALIPAVLAPILALHILIYMQPQPMELFDTFADRLTEVGEKEE